VSQRFGFILAEKACFEITMMCRLLGVSASGFHGWVDRPASDTRRRREELAARVAEVFERSQRSYGYRRVHAELARRGVEVDDELVRQLMREQGLVPVQEKAKKRGLTRPDKAAGPIPDLVGRDFTAGAPGEKLVGDITEIATGEGPLYLATAIDCYSKAVVGYAMDERYPAELVSAALDAAAGTITIAKGAIFHSDRGSQYTSQEFGRTIEKHRMRRSVGRTGICFDNSMAESFFGKLKTEYVDHLQFETRAEARRAVIWYINVFYNRQRLHSALDYRPPFEILQEWLDSQRAA